MFRSVQRATTRIPESNSAMAQTEDPWLASIPALQHAQSLEPLNYILPPCTHPARMYAIGHRGQNMRGVCFVPLHGVFGPRGGISQWALWQRLGHNGCITTQRTKKTVARTAMIVKFKGLDRFLIHEFPEEGWAGQMSIFLSRKSHLLHLKALVLAVQMTEHKMESINTP